MNVEAQERQRRRAEAFTKILQGSIAAVWADLTNLFPCILSHCPCQPLREKPSLSTSPSMNNLTCRLF